MTTTDLSVYRLGDCYMNFLTDEEKDQLKTQCPRSIGTAYLKSGAVNCRKTMAKLCTQFVRQHARLLPRDIRHSTVVHLRLGDVMCGTAWHEQLKRPLSVEQLQTSLATNPSQSSTKPYHKIYVIGKCFFAKPSSTENQEESRTASEAYLQSVLSALNATHLNSGIADVDLCAGVMANLFVQGRGYFSQLIADVREHLGRPTIHTLTVTDLPSNST